MNRTRWEIARDLLAIVLLAVLIYAAGFLIIRTRFVEQTKAATVMSYYIPKLELNSDGFWGRTIDFYKPAFALEAAFKRS